MDPNPLLAWDLSAVTVILAEDEVVFQVLTAQTLLKAGFAQDSLHVVEDGQAALRILDELPPTRFPVLMILDISMPVLDGYGCAQRIQDLVDAKRCQNPFRICVSSSIYEFRRGTIGDDFHLYLPKPLTRPLLELCLTEAQQWWAQRIGQAVTPDSRALGERDLAVKENAIKLGTSPVEDAGAEMLLADDEPVCRMAVRTSLLRIGTPASSIHEVDELPDLLEVVQSLHQESSVVVFVGNPQWLSALANYSGSQSRGLYVVSTAVDVTKTSMSCDAILPLAKVADIQDVLRKVL